MNVFAHEYTFITSFCFPLVKFIFYFSFIFGPPYQSQPALVCLDIRTCFNTHCRTWHPLRFISKSVCLKQIDIPVNLKDFINLFFVQNKCKKYPATVGPIPWNLTCFLSQPHDVSPSFFCFVFYFFPPFFLMLFVFIAALNIFIFSLAPPSTITFVSWCYQLRDCFNKDVLY